MSAKKLAMWTDVVRRKHIDDALVQCDMAHKKAAKICAKVRRLTPGWPCMDACSSDLGGDAFNRSIHLREIVRAPQ